MSLFCCPCCGKPFTRKGAIYFCPNNHTFDVSKAGYVNLLLANHKHAKDPGDSKEMCRARSLFFKEDHYNSLRTALCTTVYELTKENISGTIADVGCGEGYYTSAISRHLKNKGIDFSMAGCDISKFALHYTQRGSDVEYGVASLFQLPIKNETIDILLNIFAPICESEFARVIKPNGYLIMAVPAPRHLMGLKQIAYESPYENEVKELNLTGFRKVKIINVSDTITITGQEVIGSLFQMTPYYFKTPKEGMERVANLKTLTTEVDFSIHILQKENEYNLKT